MARRVSFTCTSWDFGSRPTPLIIFGNTGGSFLKLADYYLANPEVPRASLFSLDLKSVFGHLRSEGNKYCGAGVAYDVIDTDGKRYPCQLFSPLVLPASKLAGLTEIDFGSAEPFAYHKWQQCITSRNRESAGANRQALKRPF